MDSTWNRSRMHFVSALALAFAALASFARAQSHYLEIQSIAPASSVPGYSARGYIRQSFTLTTSSDPSGGIWVGTAANSLLRLTPGSPRTYSFVDRPYVWQGLTEGGAAVDLQNFNGGQPIYWRVGGSSNPVQSKWVSGPVISGKVSFGGTLNVPSVNLPPVILNFNPGDAETETPPGFDVEHPEYTPPPGTEPEPDPEKEVEAGTLLLDNRTGDVIEVPFGDETLRLEPGYNTFPFFGEVDEDGFPKAAPLEMLLGKTIGPDGKPVFTGRIENGIEGPPLWANPPSPVEIFPPSSGSSGPTVKVPSGQEGMTDYVQLPPGMTAGNNIPLPPGMTPGGNLTWPPGVTPGANGGLPNGVVSGGTNYLPPGVSAGTVSGNNPTPGGNGGGSGGSGGGGSAGGILLGGGVQSGGSSPDGTSGQGEEGNYIPGPSMAGFDREAVKLGGDAAEQMMKGLSLGLGEYSDKAGSVLGETPQFWTAPPVSFFSGQDSSWTRFTLGLGVTTVDIEIPHKWLTLIREILLWGIRIWFVGAVIKLLMA